MHTCPLGRLAAGSDDGARLVAAVESMEGDDFETVSGPILSNDEPPIEAVSLVRITSPSANVLGIARYRILEADGLSFAHVTRVTIYLTDLGDFAAVNEVYGRYIDPENGVMYLRIVGIPHPDRVHGVFMVANIASSDTELSTLASRRWATG